MSTKRNPPVRTLDKLTSSQHEARRKNLAAIRADEMVAGEIYL